MHGAEPEHPAVQPRPSSVRPSGRRESRPPSRAKGGAEGGCRCQRCFLRRLVAIFFRPRLVFLTPSPSRNKERTCALRNVRSSAAQAAAPSPVQFLNEVFGI